MFGIIVLLIITCFVYKNAKENGRNGVLWAIINVAVGLGIQVLFGFIVAASIGTGKTFDNWRFLINLAGVVLSFIGSYFVYRHVTRVPEEKMFTPPPPPPKFD